ncbi:hypothetical protein Bca4012_039798 [Brassica carinata]
MNNLIMTETDKVQKLALFDGPGSQTAGKVGRFHLAYEKNDNMPLDRIRHDIRYHNNLRVMRSSHSHRSDKSNMENKAHYNPYKRVKASGLNNHFDLAKPTNQSDYKSASMWHEKHVLKINEAKATSSAAGAHAAGLSIKSQRSKNAVLICKEASAEKIDGPSFGKEANVTFRSHGIEKISDVHDALVIALINNEDHLFDDTMMDVNGNERMAMDEDNLLGKELGALKPTEDDNKFMAHVEETTAIVVFEKEAGDQELPKSTSKPSSVSRVLFPMNNLNHDAMPVRRASSQVRDSKISSTGDHLMG